MSLARFQLPYMTTAQRTGVTPTNRDILFDTDEEKIYIGDGVTVGGNALGTQGPQGPQGSSGGPQGETGAQGPQGTTGTQGPQGTAGTQGPQGTEGTQGPQGTTGTQGTQGTTGTQGPQGTTGTQGPQGTTGTQGTQGTTGTFANPTTEDLQLGEFDIKLDATLSGDEKWSGIVIAGTAGATLAVGDLCYLNADDSRWELVDANLSDGYDKQLGVCVLAGNDGDSTEMLVYGKIRSAAFPSFTVGSPLYMSETAGDVTHTQPSTADVCIRILGFAITAEDLFFNPSNDYIIHT